MPQSTIGYEKKLNLALRLLGDKEGFMKYVLDGQPEPPLYFGRMKIENRDGPGVLGSLPKPGEISADEASSLDGRKVAILDTRPWDEFRAGHLPGSLHAPICKNFPIVAGSYVLPAEEIVLITERHLVGQAVRGLIRIGLDRIVGFATPETVGALQGDQLNTCDQIEVDAIESRMKSGGHKILDVRRITEYRDGHMDGAINIAHTRLLPRFDEVPRDANLLVHCKTGIRSSYATAMLQRRGLKATNVAGGYEAWCQHTGIEFHDS